MEDIILKSKGLLRGSDEISIKRFKRFKIKRSVFCIELVTFYRAMQWKYDEDPETIFFVHYLDREMKSLAIATDKLS